MEKDIVLRMTNISKSFPGVKALQNVDFALRKGEIHALMGENGAGKTTFVKLLSRLYTPSKGQIKIYGIDIRNVIIVKKIEYFSCPINSP